MIDEEAQRRILRTIDKAKSAGRLAFAGDVGPLADEGYYVAPHIFADVDPKAELAQEEVFGQVLVVLRARDENTPLSISERVNYIARTQRYALARPTQTQRAAYAIADEEFTRELGRLRRLIETDLRRLQEALEEAGAPWTPGRLPEWKGE